MGSVRAVALGVLVGLAALAASAASPRTASPPALPGEIAQFYSDANFIAAFSDRLDRQQIRATLRQQSKAPAFEPERPPRQRPVDPLSARQQEVAARLVRVEARTLRIDDITILGLGMREGAAAAEMMRIVGHEGSGDTLRVRVEVWPISYDYVARLITEYNQRGRRHASPAPPPEGRAGPPRQEAHRWRIVRGEWMRMEGLAMPPRKRM